MSTMTPESAASPTRFVATSPGEDKARMPSSKTACANCHLQDVCLPCGMKDADTDRLDSLTISRRTVKCRQPLYREGDRFQFIYAVRSGTFKSSLLLADGREQIGGFHIAGELMGLDGVADDRHASSATALEDSVICAIPYAPLSDLAAANTSMQVSMGRMMSREIVREHSLMMLLGSMSAEERLAVFLLNLSRRLKARGYSASEFHLRMSRAEMGSYLGMKLETVSRAFSAFQRQGFIKVDKRHIRIVDPDGLARAFELRMH